MALHRLGKSLKLARRRRGMSQAEVARRLGVTQQAVSLLEGGEGGLRQIVRYSKAIGTTLAVEVGNVRAVLVHRIDPSERREIEANIEWFSRLDPLGRLRATEGHVRAAQRLRRAASSAANQDADGT